MSKLQNAGKNVLNLLGMGHTETTTKPVKRVDNLKDLHQTTTRKVSVDPSTGRLTRRETPAGILTPSGIYTSEPDKEILGECVFCRDRYQEEGQPDSLLLVPKTGGGGRCSRCGCIACSEHGSWMDERFLCEDCVREERRDRIKQAVWSWLSGKLRNIS